MPHGIEAVKSLKNVSEAQYTEIWQKLFATVLLGFWGRFLFVTFLLLALFFGVRRRNPRAAVIFLLISVLIAFGGGLLSAFNII